MAGSRARGYVDAGVDFEFAGGFVDMEDAHLVGAEVGREDVVGRRVEEDAVRMRGVLPWVGARSLSEGEALEEAEGAVGVNGPAADG